MLVLLLILLLILVYISFIHGGGEGEHFSPLAWDTVYGLGYHYGRRPVYGPGDGYDYRYPSRHVSWLPRWWW